MSTEHTRHDPIDSQAGRIHALAGALYYVALIEHGLATERLFETLPVADQQVFEQLVRRALEAAASWQPPPRPVPSPTPPPTPARVLTLVPRPEAS
jgi:hypothetical protein